jgi:hypothetical protein
MREVKTLSEKACCLGKVSPPSWVGLEYMIYTDGRKYFYLSERSFSKFRITETIYKTTSLRKIRRYIQEVLGAYGLKIDFSKTDAFCDIYNLTSLTKI